MGASASQGGGIGGRGPGETKLETDRRRITTRMAKLRRELKHMQTARDTKKAERVRREIPAVAIAGYTNAGKSSLLNRLTGAGVLVEDALFATLDPTTRRTTTSDGRVFTLSDTVGFVRHLPHQLVEAFRSTLEEVAESDLIAARRRRLAPRPRGPARRGARGARRDRRRPGARARRDQQVRRRRPARRGAAARRASRTPWSSSARTGEGIDEVLAAIEADLPRPAVEVDALLPYARGDLVSKIHSAGEVLALEHTADGSRVRARVNPTLAGELAAYAVTATTA